MTSRKDYKVGTIWDLKNGETVEILEDLGNDKVLVQFKDKQGHKKVSSKRAIISGSIKNPFTRSLVGIGYEGDGEYSFSKSRKEHKHWSSMLERCYSEAHSHYGAYGGRGVYVDGYFHNFQNFAAWCNDQKGFKLQGWELDKDILVPGNKVYSANTCCFLPSKINSAFIKGKVKVGSLPTGVVESPHGGRKFRAQANGIKLGNYFTVKEAFVAYKEYKESSVKALLSDYKDLLDNRVVESIMNYRVDPVIPTMDWRLDIVNEEIYNKLKATGMLFEFYKDFPNIGTWKECEEELNKEKQVVAD